MRLPLLCATIVAVTSGCTDLGMAEPTLEVTDAALVEGDCTFGQRDDASDPAWCHEITVLIDNRDGTAPMDAQADKWRAQSDPGGREHTFPRVAGSSEIERGGSGTVTLGFDASPDVRIVRVRYIDDVTGATAAANVPDY